MSKDKTDTNKINPKKKEDVRKVKLSAKLRDNLKRRKKPVKNEEK